MCNSQFRYMSSCQMFASYPLQQKDGRKILPFVEWKVGCLNHNKFCNILVFVSYWVGQKSTDFFSCHTALTVFCYIKDK